MQKAKCLLETLVRLPGGDYCIILYKHIEECTICKRFSPRDIRKIEGLGRNYELVRITFADEAFLLENTEIWRVGRNFSTDMRPEHTEMASTSVWTVMKGTFNLDRRVFTLLLWLFFNPPGETMQDLIILDDPDDHQKPLPPKADPEEGSTN